MRYIAALFAALATIASARADVVNPILGGAGGQHFEYQCKDSGYLVGLRAYVGLWIDNVQAECAQYDTATGRTSQRAAEGPVFGGASGQTNTSNWSGNPDPCVRNQLIYRFAVAQTKNQPVLGQVSLYCVYSATLSLPTGWKVGNSVDIRGGDELKTYGTATDFRYGWCPDGLVAVGIRGRSGTYLDAFGLICGPVGASSRKEPVTVALISADGSRATYTDPTIRASNGETVLLDWCREWGANCGRPTAELYCKDRGFPFVKSFAHTGPGQRTGIVTTGEICALERCTGFREISCGKSDVLVAEESTGPSPFGAGDEGYGGAIDANRLGANTFTKSKHDIVPNRSGAAAMVTTPNCKPGFVWRLARPDDLVCVRPDSRARTARDNAEAQDHVDPAGAYGPNTCLPGYVWRNAFKGDLVCVTPETRDLVRLENRQDARRRAGN